MTENTKREEKVTEVQAEKNISEEEAKKEVAQKSVEEITGESAVTASNKVRELIEVSEAKGTSNLNKEKRDTDLLTAETYKEHIEKHPELADDLAKGLGSKHLYMTSDKVTEKVKDAADEMHNNGDGHNPNTKTSQQVIEEIKSKYPDLSENEIQSISQKISENPNMTINEAVKNESQTELFPPPKIPSRSDTKNAIEELSHKGTKALENGLMGQSGWVKVTVDVIKDSKNIETAVTNTAGKIAGNVAGNLAEKGTKKLLGDGIVGQTTGKVANMAAEKGVKMATISAIKGGLTGGL